MAFVALAVLNIAGILPPIVGEAALPLSRFCLVMAMVAIGLKLEWRSAAAYGWRPVWLLVILSALLVLLVATFLTQARIDQA